MLAINIRVTRERFACLSKRARRRRFAMAIQEYVRSISATNTVSKDQVFRFLEMQFARADKNHDGELNLDELAVFAQSISRPTLDQR
jgi:hypothetical protein